MLPHRNFQDTEHKAEDLERVSGETLARTLFYEAGSCHLCPIGCRRRTSVTVKGRRRKGEGPDLETAMLLGPACGIYDLEAITLTGYRLNELGLDALSFGGTVACAMELYGRGVIGPRETGGLDLTFGNASILEELAALTASRKAFGAKLADGSFRLAEGYGKPEYSMTVKKLEIPPYDPRASYAQALGYMTSPVGACHLRGGYAVPLAFFGGAKEVPRFSLLQSPLTIRNVQDTGILSLARGIVPDLEIHASTQMSVTDAEGARAAAELGASRVTLARELSMKEIAAIAAAVDVELEVFVHGALCVAYSGQCFSSEAWGGRSANRGLCAQACRMPYEMLVDGQLKPLGDARYLLSPNDLFALHQIPELTDLGIAAFKIEGRYKEADYVAAATAAYRKAVDDAWAGRALSVSPEEELDLEQVYSRGMGAHFVTGTNHQAVVTGRVPRHRGVRVGQVVRMTDAGVLIQTSPAHRISPLKPGDGIVFDAADWRSPQEDEEGGRVFAIFESDNGMIELRFGRDAIKRSRIRPGDFVWRTDDPAVERKLRVYTQAQAPVTKQTVTVAVTAHAGSPLVAVWNVNGLEVTVTAAADLEAAARGATAGALINGGQDCTAATRVYVHRSVADAFTARLVELFRSVRVGDPMAPETDLGTLISAAQVARVDGFVRRAVAAGARVLVGGSRPDVPGLPDGAFYLPTVVVEAGQGSEIVQQEVFGPVLVVLPFDTEAEALAMANDTPYGLASSVWTSDLRVAMRATQALNFGHVLVNDHLMVTSEMPHGGFKQSGFGKDMSMYSFEGTRG